jgi:hypothetical protein
MTLVIMKHEKTQNKELKLYTLVIARNIFVPNVSALSGSLFKLRYED